MAQVEPFPAHEPWIVRIETDQGRRSLGGHKRDRTFAFLKEETLKTFPQLMDKNWVFREGLTWYTQRLSIPEVKGPIVANDADLAAAFQRQVDLQTTQQDERVSRLGFNFILIVQTI